MELSKIKIGKTVNYKARKHTGRGKVLDIVGHANGVFAKIEDKARGVVVSVRPSQVF